MRVVIDASVLSESAPRRLTVLCDHGIERRHRLQVIDREAPEFLGWLESLAEWQRQDWLTALDLGARDDGLEPSRIEIRIVREEGAIWSDACPRLALEDALVLLAEKFQIVLEDDTGDRDFLFCMSNKQQRDFILEYERSMCLEIIPGGGFGGMIKKARIDRDRRESTYGRRWYLFDSDALRPMEPSGDSEKLKQECGKHIPHHRLRRRAIENYLPLETLRRWAYSKPPRTRGDRAARYRALLRLSDAQRHHYNMKTGFKKERDKNAEIEIYGDIPVEARDKLRKGFGERIARLFREGYVGRSQFERDGGWSEVNDAVAELVSLVR